MEVAMRLFAPPIREYDGPQDVRSIADVLEIARNHDALTDKEFLVIKTAGFRYDNREIAFAVAVGPDRGGGSKFVSRLPPLIGFTGIATDGVRLSLPIEHLDEARCYESGQVRLAQGEVLRNVTLQPARRPEFTKTDDEIVQLAVELLEAGTQCCKELSPEALPGQYWIDYSLVPDISIKRLKVLQHAIRKRRPDFTAWKIESALRRAGMSFPRSSRAA
jgi:hypothetical protein